MHLKNVIKIRTIKLLLGSTIVLLLCGMYLSVIGTQTQRYLIINDTTLQSDSNGFQQRNILNVGINGIVDKNLECKVPQFDAFAEDVMSVFRPDKPR